MTWSAFYFNASSGVRCPWRFMNLDNGGNGGLTGANGNNTPGNANWNERPRLSARAAEQSACSEGPSGDPICHDVREMKIS